MNANRYGDLVGGQGGGHNCLKLVGQPAIQIAGIDGGMWLDDDTFISRASIQLVTFHRANGFTTPAYLAPAGNVWACGGGNWATTLLLATGYESWGQHNGAPIPTRYETDWAIIDASRDGALLWALNGQYEVLWPDGTTQYVGTAFEARLDWQGGFVVLLNPGSLDIVAKGGQVLHVPLVAGSLGLNKPAICQPFVSYATNMARYVYHVTNAALGWTTTPVYAPELYSVSGIDAAGSLGPAELPNELVIDLLDRPMIALPPPIVIDPPPVDPPPPVEVPLPNLFLTTRNDLFISSRFADGKRLLVGLPAPGDEHNDFSVWTPILTRGKKVGEPNNLCYFDLTNFPGNTIGVPWDGVGIQAACPIRTGTAFTPLLQGDDHDWTIQTEPTFALTLRQDKANGIYLETFGAFPRSLQSFRMVDAKTGKPYTSPF